MTNIIPLTEGILTGVTAPTIEKLIKGGYPTVNSVAYATQREILADTTIAGKDTAQNAIDKARALIESGFITADVLLMTQMNARKLTTGSTQLDRILGGGITSGLITEFFAGFKGGKTQICFTLSVMATRPTEEGGLGGDTIYIDTENTFNSQRLQQIAETRGYDSHETLQHLHVAKANTSNHMIALVKQLHTHIQQWNVKLIIIDSLMAQFRSEYKGRGTLAERQGELGEIIGRLLRVAQANDVAIVITNQMQSTPDSTYSNPDKPTGGHVVGHAMTIRVQLRQGKGNSRIARVIDSSYLPEEAVRILVTEKGIEDEASKRKTVEDESDEGEVIEL